MTQSEGGLLCNTFRRPDLWYGLYRTILSDSYSTAQEVMDSIDPLHLWKKRYKEAYEALKIVRVISTSHEEPRISQLSGLMVSCDHPLDEALFKLWILQNIRSISGSTGESWDRQAHFLLTHRFLVEGDRRHVGRNDEAFLSHLSKYLEDAQCPVSMNRQKLSYWTMIASYLGLAVKTKGGFVATIDSGLMSNCIEVVAKTGSQTQYPLGEFIDIIDKNFFLIPVVDIQGKPTLPALVSQALMERAHAASITLTSSGDRGHIEFKGVPLLDSVTTVFTHLEVNR